MKTRTANPDDFDAVLALNLESERFLSPLTRERLGWLHQAADFHQVLEVVAQKIASAEEAVQDWGAARGISTVILRPTLIYDGLHDKNIALIASFIRRRGWFPVLGAASGLRQPVHVDDVAAACAAALTAGAPQAAYDLSGAETLSYRNLVGRVAVAVGENPRVVALPRWVFWVAVPVLRLLPSFRGISLGMFDRMNDDLVFEHSAASRDLGFEPRGFRLPEGREG